MELILQEVIGASAIIDIPEPIRDVYRMWRPSPLDPRAAAGAGARHAGEDLFQDTRASRPPVRTSRTPRCRRPGTTKRPASRGSRPKPAPGSGVPRSPLPGALFGIDVTVFQVRVSYDQKPYRRALMETYGARCIASPSNETESGRAILQTAPEQSGLARHRHFRGGRGGGQGSGGEIFARLGAQPRAAAPDRQRAGSDQAVRDGGRRSRRRHRLHRRRLEFCRPRVSVPRPATARRAQAPRHRGRAGGVPDH